MIYFISISCGGVSTQDVPACEYEQEPQKAAAEQVVVGVYGPDFGALFDALCVNRSSACS